MQNRNRLIGAFAIAVAAGLIALSTGTAVSMADDKAKEAPAAHGAGGPTGAHGNAHGAHGGPAAHGDPQDPHAYEGTMQHHVQMIRGEEGAAKMKGMMLMMAAHQHLLGDLADSEDVKKLAQMPEMKKAIADVKAAMKDHAARDKQKNAVANKNDEAMMIIAHALLKQDEEAKAMLKSAEGD